MTFQKELRAGASMPGDMAPRVCVCWGERGQDPWREKAGGKQKPRMGESCTGLGAENSCDVSDEEVYK